MKNLLRRIIGPTLTTRFTAKLVADAALHHEFRGLFATPLLPHRQALWEHCIAMIGPGAEVLLLEFGVWEGCSIQYFSQRMTHPASRFWGFDSFEGLPEAWGSYGQGTFSTGGALPAEGDSRVRFVKGWFQNTFDDAVQAAKQSAPPRPVVLVHLDADLYSSTLFLLSRLHREFDEYYFIFDEFTGGECLALLNFQQSHGCAVTFLAHTRGVFPGRVFGRMDNRRGRFVPEGRPGA